MVSEGFIQGDTRCVSGSVMVLMSQSECPGDHCITGVPYGGNSYGSGPFVIDGNRTLFPASFDFDDHNSSQSLMGKHFSLAPTTASTWDNLTAGSFRDEYQARKRRSKYGNMFIVLDNYQGWVLYDVYKISVFQLRWDFRLLMTLSFHGSGEHVIDKAKAFVVLWSLPLLGGGGRCFVRTSY